jgi:hypothetical protein
MATVKDVFRRVANFQQSQSKIMNDCITDSSETILDANRSQLMEGLDKYGQDIFPPYAPFTIKMKKLKKQPYDKVTLYDEGDFQKAMFLKVESGKVFIDSKDQKTDEIMGKYDKETEKILGIPKSKVEPINETIMTKFIRIFREMTNL